MARDIIFSFTFLVALTYGFLAQAMEKTPNEVDTIIGDKGDRKALQSNTNLSLRLFDNIE